MDKTTLRTVLKEKRFALLPAERKEKSRRICRLLSQEIKQYSVVMMYAAKEPEVETLEYIRQLIQEGKTVVVPIIQRETHTLRLSVLKDITALTCSTFNVPEPVSAEIPIAGESIQCVVLPMVGFDRSGNRLGYGAGYYDRFLAENPHVKKIGLAYSCQEADKVPTDEYDVKMDAVITEDSVVRFGK